MHPAEGPEHTTPHPERFSAYLDALRAVAALIVFLTHVRGSFFVKWSELDAASQEPLNYALFMLTRLGRESVIIFFVLSGYLVGGQALSALRCSRFSPVEYFAARVSRLYAVVLPALLLTAALDFLGGNWSDSHDGPMAFLINLVFLQQIFGEVYGSNGPLWSLAYEWWFYLMFGLLLIALAQASARTKAVALTLLGASVVMLALRCPQILLMLPLWLAGVLVRSLTPIRLPGRLAVAGSFALLCAALILSSAQWNWIGDFAVGIATALFIYFIRSLPAPRGRWTVLASQLAAFSFSLYAVHYPLNLFLFSWFERARVSHAGAKEWLVWAGIVLLEASICWCFY